MSTLAQVQLAESTVVVEFKRNLTKSIKAESCTASALFLLALEN